MINYIFLADLIKPEPGLTFWTILIFLCLLFVLSRFAWKPIMAGIKEREQSITNALEEAQKAREEMKNLTSQNEEILRQAREERDRLLKEGKEIKDKTIAEAKNAAAQEVAHMKKQATDAIIKEQEIGKKALQEFAANLAVDIATKVIKREVSTQALQEELIESYVSSSNNN